MSLSDNTRRDYTDHYLLAERRDSVLLSRSRSAWPERTCTWCRCQANYAVVSFGRMARDSMPYIVYILKCADGSYYTGSTDDIKKRLWQHEQGVEPSAYTYSRRPVKLLWASEETRYYYDALRWERQIKGWSRAKKEALIRGEFDTIHEIVKAERKRRAQNKKPCPR
jgi:putative endonuclease